MAYKLPLSLGRSVEDESGNNVRTIIDDDYRLVAIVFGDDRAERDALAQRIIESENKEQ